MNDVDILLSIKQDYQKSLAKIIIYTIKNLEFPVGINKLSEILSGSKKSFIINYELDKMPTYSLLQYFKKDNIRIIIEELLQRELIEIGYVLSYIKLPVLRVSQNGNLLLDASMDITFTFIDKFKLSKIPELSNSEHQLFIELKSIRKNLAEIEDIPAYFVCKDITLIDIAKAKPLSKEELIRINGIGEKFIQKYGDVFIEKIRAFESQLIVINTNDEKTDVLASDSIEAEEPLPDKDSRQRLIKDAKRRTQESLKHKKTEPRWLWTPYDE